MAEIKFLKPFSSWRWPTGAHKIKLSHEEIITIADASNPVAALTSLIPQIGGYVSAGIVLLMWSIKKFDEQHGNEGVIIILPAPALNPLNPLGLPSIESPDKW